MIEEYERRMSNIKKYSEEIAKNNKTVEGIVKQIDTSAYTTDFSGSSKKQKEEKTDYASQLADARVKAQHTTEKLRIQIMQEGIAKRMAMAKQEYDESVADIDKQERDMLAKWIRHESRVTISHRASTTMLKYGEHQPYAGRTGV